ncbi:MAG: quinone-dependent dihydroorotate dehydrogenase, partial [Patescibacteria group bacterium]|nr:quinone-dependent dihydroorotate dehydrogenase [Patescibacteria group bacterium]
EKIVERLKDLKLKIPTGVSIAKTNSPETVSEESGIADYVKAYQCFINAGIGDYFTVNISCPNAFGGEPFTTPEKLDRLLNAITRIPSNKPLFIKMPAEMPLEDLDSMAEIACKYKITGFVSTNLAKDRSNGNIKDKNVPDQGGLSGKVVQEQSDRQIAYLYKRTQGEFVIIGCGGVFTAEDAYRKIKLGASLIQLITGMIFQGPQAISSINQGLAELLKRDGYKNIAEAVGTDNK